VSKKVIPASTAARIIAISSLRDPPGERAPPRREQPTPSSETEMPVVPSFR
jgi:hypothetical protein